MFLLVSIPKSLKRWIKNTQYRGMLRRRVICPKLNESPSHPRIWLNGVSVGEIVSLQPLVHILEKKYPGIELVISTTTGTGYHRAKTLYPDHNVIGYPLDLTPIIKRFIKKIKPTVFITVELDLWPNFLLECAERHIPYVVVSGRLSEKSAVGFEKVKGLLSDPFDAITLFLGQDKTDVERAIRIGIAEEKVKIGGNLKFDLLVEGVVRDSKASEIFSEDEKKMFICASTHHPEEEMILNELEKLDFKGEYSDWRLILTPRHPERTSSICELLKSKSWDFQLYSELEAGAALKEGCVLIDKIGVLSSLYAYTDLCFIGGSLIPHGGQNMIEPAAQGIPVLFGPHVFNFREATRWLLMCDAAIMVENTEEFREKCNLYLASSDERLKLATRSKQAIDQKKGVALKVLNEIEHLLEG